MKTLSDRVLHQIASEVYSRHETDSEVREVNICSDLFEIIEADGKVITNVSGALVFDINRYTSEDTEGYTDVIINRYDDMDCMIDFECE
ncbi:hypothetical protein F8160_00060 [Bacillus sp. CH126_4D]|uniref:hypothetical protein n=1 Tax=unclassified Bacillus (in: firmicutes) TaxID=185979 RepID=UPI00124D9F37|nr:MULTISPECIES: hypothetical protein [unclassified Bacillus (in: firmicutes)]KAB2460766.1 hypothetical protein F8162_00725 [Bacillus sp. CH140a_4T]KAB2476410.1 hypothetical protein F8160_00060 [Bacillus sp. CH126_4D]